MSKLRLIYWNVPLDLEKLFISHMDGGMLPSISILLSLFQLFLAPRF